MKIFVLGTAALLVVSQAHASQGQECISIENDIARLACFDKAFATVEAKSERTPEEVFAELSPALTSTYIRSHGRTVVVKAAFDPGNCR